MSKRLLGFAEKYVTKKIGVEIKCCVMFFMTLCFYSGYRLICGIWQAEILHMIEMVLLAYLLGWMQALIGSDFDEVDKLSPKDWGVVIVGSALYTAASLLFGWLNGGVVVTVIFFVYMMISYLCIFLIYKMKRAIDAKLLNNDLRQFQLRNKEK